MITGSYTAIITPFRGDAVDYDGLDRLTDFQTENGISGILAVGTTGESPTLTWEEHHKVVEHIVKRAKNKCRCIAGAGSNNTKEALGATKHAAYSGADAVLMVDPYYNGPSSLEIRKEYIGPVAAAFPDMQIIPYIIPGRTGTQLLPEDLALLSREFKNVKTVKEATGSIENMRRTRECCGPDFTILSGDDGMTAQMMTDPAVKASGVISVVSNIAPRAVADMVRFFEQGKTAEAQKLAAALAPLFDLVTVKTMEKTPYGEVVFKARNPLAAKSLMAILGMPSGGCRQPMGKLTRNALDKVLSAARKVQENNPEILKPLADFFRVNIAERLATPANWEGLFYTAY
jgi:4-hydroxy-tetrahydrodipicolinate synthase